MRFLPQRSTAPKGRHYLEIARQKISVCRKPFHRGYRCWETRSICLLSEAMVFLRCGDFTKFFDSPLHCSKTNNAFKRRIRKEELSQQLGLKIIYNSVRSWSQSWQLINKIQSTMQRFVELSHLLLNLSPISCKVSRPILSWNLYSSCSLTCFHNPYFNALLHWPG